MFDEFDDTDVHMKDDESSSDEDAPKEMGFGKVSRIFTGRLIGYILSMATHKIQ